MRQESLGRPFRRANKITAQAPINCQGNTEMQAVSQDYVVTVATTKAPQGLLQIPVLATDRDDAQDKAIDWMEFMGIPHGEVLKVVLKGEAA